MTTIKKKLLITGASGFVGQNILHHLFGEKSDLDIYNLGRTPIADAGVKNIHCLAETFDFNVIHEQFDYIIHLLALSNNAYCSDFSYAQKVNIEFTKKLLDFALTQKKLKKIIHISSIITYDSTEIPPVKENAKLNLNYTTYSFTKGVAENYVDYYRVKLGLPVIIFRLSNIYGPYQKYINSPFLMPSKIVEGMEKKTIEVASASPRRDWIYSEDAAKAIVKSLDSSFTGILNLGSGKSVSVGEIMKIISQELGVPYSERKENTTGPLNFYCDISAIKQALLWQPETDMNTGIRNTIRYIKEKKS